MALRSSLVTAAAATLIAVGTVTVAFTAYAQDAQPKTGRYTAQDIANAKPVASFEVEASQLRLILGGASGKGVLHYQGKDYPFTIKAATAGGVGASKINAKGDVYFMKNIEDFPGLYSAATAGATIGKGAGASQYENNKGVFLKVSSKSEGLALTLGLGGVQVDFVK